MKHGTWNMEQNKKSNESLKTTPQSNEVDEYFIQINSQNKGLNLALAKQVLNVKENAKLIIWDVLTEGCCELWMEASETGIKHNGSEYIYNIVSTNMNAFGEICKSISKKIFTYEKSDGDSYTFSIECGEEHPILVLVEPYNISERKKPETSLFHFKEIALKNSYYGYAVEIQNKDMQTLFDCYCKDKFFIYARKKSTSTNNDDLYNMYENEYEIRGSLYQTDVSQQGPSMRKMHIILDGNSRMEKISDTKYEKNLRIINQQTLYRPTKIASETTYIELEWNPDDMAGMLDILELAPANNFIKPVILTMGMRIPVTVQDSHEGQLVLIADKVSELITEIIYHINTRLYEHNHQIKKGKVTARPPHAGVNEALNNLAITTRQRGSEDDDTSSPLSSPQCNLKKQAP